MPFLVKGPFIWNECLKNADINISNKFFAMTLEFFVNFDKLCQMLLTCHVLAQLDHLNRITDAGGGGGRNLPPPVIPICKKPSLSRVNLQKQQGILLIRRHYRPQSKVPL